VCERENVAALVTLFLLFQEHLISFHIKEHALKDYTMFSCLSDILIITARVKCDEALLM
jgi:hypothetical protein